MMALAPNLIRGVNYGPFAMYNAVYKGARISDVLKFAGIKIEGLENKWLTSTGADEDFPGDPVQTSVPLSRALDPKYEVMVAYAANGKPLPPDHGYPVRLFVPGYIGLRSTKWLRSIEITETPTPARWQ